MQCKEFRELYYILCLLSSKGAPISPETGKCPSIRQDFSPGHRAPLHRAAGQLMKIRLEDPPLYPPAENKRFPRGFHRPGSCPGAAVPFIRDFPLLPRPYKKRRRGSTVSNHIELFKQEKPRKILISRGFWSS